MISKILCLLVVFGVACGNEDPLTNEGYVSSSLTKGNGGVSGVDTNYCDDPAFPCVAGESDCDADSQCLGALVCGVDNGPFFGFGPLWDVCVEAHCTNGILDADETFTDCGGVDCGSDCTSVCGDLPASPSTSACNSDCPCSQGEADCNADVDCAGALVCGVNNGDQFGLGTNWDVCVPAHCTNGVLDADETTVDCGGVDCGGFCGMDCGSQPPNGDPNHCSDTCICGAGEGDCDGNQQCAAGLTCTDNVGASFGFSANTDVCLGNHCTNMVQDGDEDGVDCGGSCVPCSGAAGFVDSHGLASDETASSVAVGANGDVVIGGHFFDQTNLGGSTFTRVGSSATTTDIFVAKYDPSGAHQWSHQFASDASDGNLDIDVEIGPSGEVALAGNFNRTVDFGGGFALTAVGRVDAFVALLEPDGSTRWAVGFGGTEIDSAYDVEFTSSGDVVVAGAFETSADFGSGSITSAGGSDIFVVSLSGATGATIASATFGGTESDTAYAVAVQGARTYIGGAYRQSVPFGSITSPSAAGATDAFVVELSSSLVPLRARFFGGTNVDRVRSLDVDPSLRVAAVGTFGSTVDFGFGNVTSSGGVDVFVLQLSGTLVPTWVSSFGGTSNDEALGASVDDDSRDVLVTGYVDGTVTDFPGGSSTGFGGRDAFLVRYTQGGALVDADRDGGAGIDLGYAVDTNGAFFSYCGVFSSTATVAGTALSAVGGRDIFVGQFSL